jgi:branched-chain amino acid transport system ATP-binding protein
MLKLDDVYSGYKHIEVLHGISLDVKERKITCIIGPNGSGKSTILKTIVKIADLTSGDIYLDGEDLTQLSTIEILRKGILYVCQGRVVFRYLTVEENLRIGAWVLKDKNLVKERFGQVYEQIPILKSKAKVLAGYLSGGEQTMLSLGRALMLKPRIIMLDEPSLGLAPIALNHVYKKIRNLNKSGMTVLLVEQNVRKALSISDEVYVLDMGTNKFYGDPNQILSDGKLVKLYLGLESSVDKS